MVEKGKMERRWRKWRGRDVGGVKEEEKEAEEGSGGEEKGKMDIYIYIVEF